MAYCTHTHTHLTPCKPVLRVNKINISDILKINTYTGRCHHPAQDLLILVHVFPLSCHDGCFMCSLCPAMTCFMFVVLPSVVFLFLVFAWPCAPLFTSCPPCAFVVPCAFVHAPHVTASCVSLFPAHLCLVSLSRPVYLNPCVSSFSPVYLNPCVNVCVCVAVAPPEKEGQRRAAFNRASTKTHESNYSKTRL